MVTRTKGLTVEVELGELHVLEANGRRRRRRQRGAEDDDEYDADGAHGYLLLLVEELEVTQCARCAGASRNTVESHTVSGDLFLATETPANFPLRSVVVTPNPKP